jgi:hypothetical protein
MIALSSSGISCSGVLVYFVDRVLMAFWVWSTFDEIPLVFLFKFRYAMS